MRVCLFCSPVEQNNICLIGDFPDESGWVEVFNTPRRVDSFLKGTKE